MLWQKDFNGMVDKTENQIQLSYRDVTMGKIQLRPLRWWVESAPPLVGIGLRYLKI